MNKDTRWALGIVAKDPLLIKLCTHSVPEYAAPALWHHFCLEFDLKPYRLQDVDWDIIVKEIRDDYPSIRSQE